MDNLGLVSYVNFCWYFLWIESLYKQRIGHNSDAVGYWLRKEYRRKVGELHSKKDKDFE